MKRLLTLMLMLVIFITASAQAITPEEALKKAQAFAAQRQAALSKGEKSRELTLKQIQQHDLLKETTGTQLFMYNIGEGDGFVIVSGDERVTSILGYADEGSIDINNMPENMRTWLGMYAREIASLSNTATLTAVPKHAAITPLLTCNWNQDAPYNNDCPYDTKRGSLSYTGCVATAMAQVLYHVRPTGCKSIPSYTSNYHEFSTTVSKLSATMFNWDIMRDTYSSNDKDESAKEVAKLMRYCGQACNMSYSAAASGAYEEDACEGLKKYFDLSNSIEFIKRYNYSKTEWDAIIYKELHENRPILVGGGNYSSGHAFVCDGYDGNGLYHINWGWGGSSNGYFEINHLNPSSQGIGGSNSGYSSDIDAIIGMKVKVGEEETIQTPTLYRWHDTDEGSSTTEASRTSQDEDFEIKLHCSYYDQNNITDYEICWGLYDSNNNLISKTDAVSYKVEKGYASIFNLNYSLGKNLANGTYYLKPLGHQKGATEWLLCNNYINFIVTMTINGNNATLTYKEFKYNKFKTSNISINEKAVVNTKVPFKFNVKNIGTGFACDIYVVVDTEDVTSIPANLDPGEDEDFSVDLSFKTTGKHYITLALKGYNSQSKEYVYDFISEAVMCVVVDEEICPLDVTATLLTPATKNGGIYYTNTENCEIEVTYTNNNTTAYNSVVGVYRGFDDNGTLKYYTNPTQCNAFIEPNSSFKQTFTFTLEEGAKLYYIPTYKISSTEWKNWSYNQWINESITICFDPTATSIRNIPNIDTTTPLYSIDGRHVGTSSPLRPGIYIRNGKKFVVK